METRMTETERYVRRYLKEALASVEASRIPSVGNGLDVFEKALIYHYTGTGYISVNRSLRRRNGNKASILLERVVEKLPDWQGLVYRTTYLTKKQIAAYRDSLETGVPFIEPAFVSTSRSATKVRDYPNWNAQFQIFSARGKRIEECSCLGSILPPNEEEVLILPRHHFQVLDVNDSSTSVLIIMREL